MLEFIKMVLISLCVIVLIMLGIPAFFAKINPAAANAGRIAGNDLRRVRDLTRLHVWEQV